MSKSHAQTTAEPTYSFQENDHGPTEAVQMYLGDREGEVSPQTQDKRRWHLRKFTKWCRENGVEHTRDLDNPALFRYKQCRGKKIKKVTLKSELSTLKNFLEVMERAGVVANGLADAVDPSAIKLSRDERAKTERVSPKAADDILSDLGKFKPYSRDHVVFMLLWESGMRTGALLSLDLDDWHSRKQSLTVEHRPDDGTRLKNGEKGTREIMVSDRLAEVLNGYVEHHRLDRADDYGRDPLITTTQGRPCTVTIRTTVYDLTEDCDHVDGKLGPHAIRKGSIGRHLSDGWLIQDVAERCDVTEQKLRQHYDTRPENEKMLDRRDKYDL